MQRTRGGVGVGCSGVAVVPEAEGLSVVGVVQVRSFLSLVLVLSVLLCSFSFFSGKLCYNLKKQLIVFIARSVNVLKSCLLWGTMWVA